MKTALSIAFVLVAACGGKKSTPAAPAPAAKGGDEHAQMMPEVAKFHDVLAPRWHAEKGPQRMADTCGAIADFESSADAIAKATPPAGTDQEKWTAQTKELTDAVGALGGTCKSNDATAFEPAFERVHVGFHGVMEAAGGHKEGMGHEGMEGMEHEHEGMGSDHAM